MILLNDPWVDDHVFWWSIIKIFDRSLSIMEQADIVQSETVNIYIFC